jgi:hypothetical protein
MAVRAVACVRLRLQGPWGQWFDSLGLGRRYLAFRAFHPSIPSTNGVSSFPGAVHRGTEVTARLAWTLDSRPGHLLTDRRGVRHEAGGSR